MTVTPAGTTIQTGKRFNFTATVQGTGSFNSAVTWAVNGIIGGNAENGTINNGSYLAPATVPGTNPVTITATSVADPSKSGSVTATISAIAIIPANPSIYYGQTQQFTATVSGMNNPTVQWSASLGNIDSTGLYTAPAGSSVPGTDTVTATVAGVGSASSEVTLLPLPTELLSISPVQAVVGQTVTLTGQNLYNVTHVFFSMPNTNVIDASFTSLSPTQITARVPVGAVSGPVFVQYTPLPAGGTASSNGVSFTRLPNLRIRAQSNELSSGETTQFDFRLLGGMSSNAVEWTADQGTISTDGLYQAPTVSSEAYATITGCLSGTQACDSEMIRLLPIRILPYEPVTSLGNTVQLGAIQGGAQISPTWSLPAADGNIDSGGLFTADDTTAQAGPVPVSAISGGASANTSVAVTGGFPGIVDRLWDYFNLNSPGKLGTYVASVAVKGNRAYCVDQMSPYAPNSSYAAIDVYDITDPHQPVWVDAVDSMSASPTQTFTYGNNLFIVDSGYAGPVPSRISIYNIQSGTPVLTSVVGIPQLAISQVNNGIVYGLGEFAVRTTSPTFPVYTFDVQNGSVTQNEYDLTPPPGIQPLAYYAISGNGHMVYVSMQNQIGLLPSITIAAYDVSTTPATLDWSVLSDAGFNRLQVVNQLLFADGEVRDLSSSGHGVIASFPFNLVEAVAGNQVLGFGELENYMILDVSDPANIVVAANIASQAAENPFFAPRPAWAGNSFLSADGVGGLSVYDASAPGGPRNEDDITAEGDFQDANVLFLQVWDQAFQQSTLYAAGVGGSIAGSSTGGLITFDTTQTRPTPLARLLYPNEAGLAIQVSGTEAFLGLTDYLKVVDVTNSSALFEVASLPIPTNALALSGNILFDGTGDSRLVVVDVSNPTTPNQIASVPIPGPANTMRLEGNLLFIADGLQGLLVFDVSNPASPVLLSQLTLSAPVWDVAPSGTVALLAADTLGLVTVDVSNPAQVQQLSQTILPFYNPFPQFNYSGSSATLAISVAVQNNLVYIGTANNDEDTNAGVATFDFAQPQSPRMVGFRRFYASNIPVITPSGNNLIFAESGIVTQFDNSFPYNSIELYDPPLALAQSYALQGNVQPSTSFRYSKLDKHWKANTLLHLPSKIIPRCMITSQCSETLTRTSK